MAKKKSERALEAISARGVARRATRGLFILSEEIFYACVFDQSPQHNINAQAFACLFPVTPPEILNFVILSRGEVGGHLLRCFFLIRLQGSASNASLFR